MKYLILILTLVSTKLFAVTVEVVNFCEDSPLVKMEFEFFENSNVGELTISVLEQSRIPFKGNEMGINSINNSPIGMNALEVISDTEMRAYGWCYSVDGVEPASFPDKVIITNPDSHISWYFGFAYYKEGDWVSQCEKTHIVQPEFICQ